MNNHLLALGDFSRDQLQALIDRALELKAESRAGVRHPQLEARSICLLFEKPPTRTRVSFEAAMYGLGGQVIFMNTKEAQLGRIARVLSALMRSFQGGHFLLLK